MKVTFIIFQILLTSGCVELRCYSSIDDAIGEGDKFCGQGIGNKQLCEELIIARKKACRLSKDDDSTCVVSGQGIETIISGAQPKCTQLDEKSCRTLKSCEWTFKNPIDMKFY